MRITTPVIQKFDYRPPLPLTIALFLLACGGVVVFGYIATQPMEGFKVRGIKLTADQSRWLWRTLFLLSPIGVVQAGSLLFVSLFRHRRVALTQHSLIVPRPTWTGLSCDEIEIPFSEITRVDVIDWMGSAQLLRIRYTGGKVNVPSNMFLSRRVFDQLAQAVTAAAGHEP